MKLTTEYLIIVAKSASPATYNLCENVGDFKRLLAAEGKLKMVGDDKVATDAIVCGCHVVANEIKDAEEQRFFHVLVNFDGDEQWIESYSALLKHVKRAAHSIGHCETIWDDVAKFYSELSYPLVHHAESLMRKLITYFMLTIVGKDWIDTKSPSELRDALEKGRKNKERLGEKLHQVDFIVLKDVLFKAYPNKSIESLYALLRSKDAPNEISVAQLEDYRPRSNWDRYFSAVVACEGSHIDKAWAALYELRCEIAHNALIGRAQYDRIRQLVEDLSQHLEKAIDNIGQIHVPAEVRDQVAENIATNISAAIGVFIEGWKILEALIFEMASDIECSDRTVDQATTALLKEGVIDEVLSDAVIEMRIFRDSIVRGAGPQPSEQDIQSRALRLEQLNARLRGLLRVDVPAVGPKWKDVISTALARLGGTASLAEIYEDIRSTASRDLPENWKSCVRYTLQLNSSDTETFARGSGEDLFQRVGRGRWKLR